MQLKKLTLAVAGVSFALASSLSMAQDAVQFVPSLVYRTGPYAAGGNPFADGVADYLNLINVRDGGVNGVKIQFEECDTAYDNSKGVECYERLKGKGPTGASSMSPLSTGITYAILDRAANDKIPILSMGYGRTDASDGRVFPYVFNIPATYQSGTTAVVKYIGAQEGGLEKLKGKKIALVYHDSAFGKEPIPVLTKLSEQYGFKLDLFPVAPPGLEQKATWLKVGRQLKPDWVIMQGWGVMNPTAIKEAAAVGFPREKMVGIWWTGTEPDVIAAGDAAKGFKNITFHASGTEYPVIQDIIKNLYDQGKGTAKDRKEVGITIYNRGVLNAAVLVEGIRTAQEKFGKQPLTGEQVRWGLENLNLSKEHLQKVGLTDFMPPVKVSCMDHEGGGAVRVQQWDGQKFNYVSDWITPMSDVVRPLLESSAAQYAKEKNITPRDCSKEG